MGDSALKIASFRKGKVNYGKDEHQLIKYERMNTFYAYLVYNMFLDQYYRFIQLPFTEEEIAKGASRPVRYKILVYDKIYKLIGYAYYSFNNYNLNMLFPHQQGMAIINFKEQTDENKVPVDVLSFE